MIQRKKNRDVPWLNFLTVFPKMYCVGKDKYKPPKHKAQFNGELNRKTLRYFAAFCSYTSSWRNSLIFDIITDTVCCVAWGTNFFKLS